MHINIQVMVSVAITHFKGVLYKLSQTEVMVSVVITHVLCILCIHAYSQCHTSHGLFIFSEVLHGVIKYQFFLHVLFL